jgi:phosphopantothenoylcysteine decarboxylase/phosphopantothenate--cysteine ligase
VKSARDVLQATLREEPCADDFVATAAVADWRPATESGHKIKKPATGAAPVVAFTENPDILQTVAQGARARSGALFCVGFAAETDDLVTHARAKLARKGIPLIVGNIGPLTFGLDDNQMLLVDAQAVRELPRASKTVLARQLVAEIARRIAA